MDQNASRQLSPSADCGTRIAGPSGVGGVECDPRCVSGSSSRRCWYSSPAVHRRATGAPVPVAVTSLVSACRAPAGTSAVQAAWSAARAPRRCGAAQGRASRPLTAGPSTRARWCRRARPGVATHRKTVSPEIFLKRVAPTRGRVRSACQASGASSAGVRAPRAGAASIRWGRAGLAPRPWPVAPTPGSASPAPRARPAGAGPASAPRAPPRRARPVVAAAMSAFLLRRPAAASAAWCARRVCRRRCA